MTSWYTNAGVIGGQGGIDYSFIRYNPVRKITFWYDNNAILAIEIVSVDGSSDKFGEDRSDSGSITFAPGELITNLVGMETDGGGSNGAHLLGQVRIVTNKGQNKSFGPGGSWTYNWNVGSGLLCGIQGKVGKGIDNGQFLFFKPIKKIIVSIDKDDPLWKGPIGKDTNINQFTVATATFTNDSETKSVNWDWNGTVEVENTSTFSLTTAETFGVSVEVSAGLFDIADVKTGFQWSREDTRGYETTNTTMFTVGNEVGGVLAPKQSIGAITTTQLGQLDIEYNAKVEVLFVDATIKNLSYSEKGRFQNSQYAHGETTVSDPQSADGGRHVNRNRARPGRSKI